MSDIALTPDTYCPSKNAKGQYEDRLPYGAHDRTYVCECTNNRSYRRSALKGHFRTQTHQRWLESMNSNQDNHLQQYLDLVHTSAATERSQKLMIAELQKQLDIAKARVVSQEHLIRIRDGRIQQLETELFTLQPPPEMQEEGKWGGDIAVATAVAPDVETSL